MKMQTQSLNSSDVISQLILNGDLSKLSQSEKINYYKGYCDRMGLDPFTKPFDLLRLNGKEVLYCTRSGTQQLNKKHALSHTITSREIIEAAGVYQVTARACLPDGRCTESIGAVNIGGLKGDAYANAIMKAETKAKRRATLDLLGLGVLDETEVETIPNVKPVEFEMITEVETVSTPLTDDEIFDEVAIVNALYQCETMQQLRDLYMSNQKMVDSLPHIKSQFTTRKNELKSNINA